MASLKDYVIKELEGGFGHTTPAQMPNMGEITSVETGFKKKDEEKEEKE